MIGKTISHYRVVDELGRGGMGVVYKAEDTKLKRTVALKFLPPAVGNDERVRFEQEAQAVAHLQHPNICTIYEIDEFEGQPYIAMAFIDGVELKALTAHGPMALDEAVSVAIQVATGLEEAHEHGIVHRDVKSANVMINRKGLAKVMDFGLAKRHGRTQITQAGLSLGTIDYMSPEQTRGDAIDHRTDIWSFGVMLYEMIAGQMPFRGEFDQAVIYAILNQDAAPLSSVRPDTPPALSDVVAKATAKRPDDRYQSMADLIADLHHVQAEVGVPAGTSVSGAISWSAAGRPSTGGASAARTTPSTAGRAPDARAFQIVGAYAALAALVVAGLHWLVNHYPVSPNLPDFGLWASFALLPTVAVLAFFRGWGGRVRAIGVPVTLAAAAALLFMMFGEKDLGAATRSVTVTDENGNRVERVVPKAEFHKRVALFYFDNAGGNTDEDWLSYTIAHMIRMDLMQDAYVNVGLGFTRSHVDAGFAVPVGSPVMFKRKLAQDYHYPHFVTGAIDHNGGVFTVDVSLLHANDGSSVTEHRYTGPGLFALADSISLQLRHDLEVPDYHIAESPDVAVADMLTGSMDAMKEYVEGVNARWQTNDYNVAVGHFNRAVEADPTFAAAYTELFTAYINLNRGDDASTAVRSALQHKYKLPERMQLSLMNGYHESRQDAEAILLNARRWVSLYPDDVEGHLALAGYYQERANDVPAAIAERKIALELSPERYPELQNIASLYESVGDFENAELYLRRYADLFPEKFDSFSALGGFYRRRGEFERARANYKQALVIDPERMSARTSLADLERHTGNFDEALRQCEDALASAQSVSDSSAALAQLAGYHTFRGHANTALEYQQAMYREQSRYLSPLQVSINRLFSLSRYVDAGQASRALAIAKEMEEKPAVPWFRSFVAAGYIITYATIDDPANVDAAERYLRSFAEWVDQAGMQQLDWVVMFCTSITLEWRGKTDEALASAKQAIAAMPADDSERQVWLNLMAGKLAREVGKYAEAEAFLDDALKIEPWSPQTHYELARVYQEQGQLDKARDHIEKAMKVWEGADEGYAPARKARELAEVLRTSI